MEVYVSAIGLPSGLPYMINHVLSVLSAGCSHVSVGLVVSAKTGVCLQQQQKRQRLGSHDLVQVELRSCHWHGGLSTHPGAQTTD